MTGRAAHNSTHTQVAVQWLNQALCFYQSLCFADSESLRNRHLRVAANRCGKCDNNSSEKNTFNLKIIIY